MSETVFEVRIRKDLRERVVAHAEKNNWTIQTALEQLLEEGLKEEQQKPKQRWRWSWQKKSDSKKRCVEAKNRWCKKFYDVTSGDFSD